MVIYPFWKYWTRALLIVLGAKNPGIYSMKMSPCAKFLCSEKPKFSRKFILSPNHPHLVNHDVLPKSMSSAPLTSCQYLRIFCLYFHSHTIDWNSYQHTKQYVLITNRMSLYMPPKFQLKCNSLALVCSGSTIHVGTTTTTTSTSAHSGSGRGE